MMKNSDWQKCILNKDSRNVISRIPDNSIDLILTDPPYNIGKHSTGNIPIHGRSAMNNDVADWDWVDFNPEEWADEFVRILKPTGNLFIFTSYNQIGRWYDSLDHKFDTSNFMVWHKTNPAPKIFKAGFLNSCEMIFTCWNKKHTWNFISQAEMHNFIESPICMRPERISDPKHPAQKPLLILRKLIKIASNEGDIVFDPFMGVGSIGVAALELGRRFIGVELNSKYYDAAKNRIEKLIQQHSTMNKEQKNDQIVEKQDVVREESLPYQSVLFEKLQYAEHSQSKETGLSPIIKWAGGKEKELEVIMYNAPAFVNYYEPFVGGGSVFMSFNANHFYINDKCSELIMLYRSISNSDCAFFYWINNVEEAWDKMLMYVKEHSELVEWYLELREGKVDESQMRMRISDFLQSEWNELLSIIDKFPWHKEDFKKELMKNVVRKILRMHKIEREKQIMPNDDIYNNIETSFMSALYMFFRVLYNDSKLMSEDKALATSMFVFIRNYAYSGMFRYNDKGEFNVPYGGIGYNHKTMRKKMSYYQSHSLLEHFKNTTIDNLDFEDFFHKYNPTKDDFIFLDPPYDTEFSTYAQNEFRRSDQERLAKFLVNECCAKWMMIIKNTPFIFNLYNHKGINISTFDKTYRVSFMNRNDKKTEHLLITNY